MAQEGSITLSTEGAIIRASGSIKEMLGFFEDELNGRDFASILDEGAVGGTMTLLYGAQVTGPVLGQMARLRHKDGGVVEVYLSIYPMRNRTGELNSFMLTLGGAKTTEVPGILTEEFQRMFRFSNDAVAITDKDGSVIDVNQNWLDTYGYKKHEVLGKNPRILKSTHSTKEMYEKMWGDILDPKIGFWRGEIINITKTGKEVPVMLSINAIKDGRGEIKNFLGIAFNMTRQKELDKINKMYVDYIIHDLRGPLTSIMANTEILLMLFGQGIQENVKRKLDVILASSHRINGMTSDMLDFSRAQSGVLVLKKEKARFDDLLKGAIQPFETSDKKLYLNGVPPAQANDDATEILADPDKLQRIIYNLLSNAFKHAAKEVRLDWRIDGGMLRVDVSDDGRGISKETAERIFDAFYQTPEGIKTGGAGLGLSIVKSFVEAHDGSVWIEPFEGRGATLGFTIPVG